MTGPDHAREALRLAEHSKRPTWTLPQSGAEYTPTEDARHRVLMEAHLHASLARTAALVDSESYSDGTVHRSNAARIEWHDLFNVPR